MIRINASRNGYIFDIVEVTEGNRQLVSRLVQTSRGYEFGALASAPRFVIKGKTVTIAGASITPKATREIEPSQLLGWLREHGLVFSPNTGEVVAPSEMVTPRFDVDVLSASCLGVPLIKGRVYMYGVKSDCELFEATGYIGNNGRFYGAVNYATVRRGN